MTPTPTPSQPADPTPTTQREADAQLYRAILHGLLDIGAETARLAHEQARAQAAIDPATAPDPTIAYDRIARAIRRTVALAQSVTAPAPALIAPAQAPASADPTLTPAAARRKIRRAVEDRISRVAEGARAETLRTGLYDRLDEPDLDDDIAGRPMPELIAEIFTDLCASLRHPGALPRHLRRDLEALRAQAARLPAARPALPDRPPPRPPKPRPRIPRAAGPPPQLAHLNDAELRRHRRR